MKRLMPWLAGWLLLAVSGLALAHKPSDSYLTLRVEPAGVSGQWDIALRDLEFAIGLDADGDGAITWGELRARHEAIAAYALARLSLATDAGDCPLRPLEQLVDRHSDGAYAVLRFAADCPAAPRRLSVDYRLLFDLDPQHKGLLNLHGGEITQTAIFAPDAERQTFELSGGGRLRQLAAYLRHGVWHIWIGYDHVLFLLALLLPAVLRREGGDWRPVARLAPALRDVAWVVTAFTLAHSLTLAAAALGWVSLPTRLVESAIAASIVLAAANNLYPLFGGRRWLAALVFGLVHGFGFASVLADLGLPRGALAWSLAGFNLGVELGQLAIVAVFLPLAYALRGTRFYRRGVLVGGSWLVIVLAAGWLVERALSLKFMPW